MADAAPVPTPVCFLEINFHQAQCLFSVLTRAGAIKGSKQTHRSRVLNLLASQLKEFDEARMELIKEYAVKDDKGEPKLRPDGATFDIPDQKKFDDAFEALVKEQTIIIDGRSDEIKNKALAVAYDILVGDDCPQLAPPQPGQAAAVSEVVLFADVVDAFKFEPRVTPAK